ncbi:MAG: DUF1636 domain-containing protein [Pseudomonadota bacterium]
MDGRVKDTAETLPGVDLLVCVKCRKGREIPEDDTRPGAHLLDRLLAGDVPEGVRVRGVECLSNCDYGCSVALRGVGRWSYVYGNLDETADAEMILHGAARYQATADGLVPWRERSQHFRKNCIARIPPMEATDG